MSIQRLLIQGVSIHGTPESLDSASSTFWWSCFFHLEYTHEWFTENFSGLNWGGFCRSRTSSGSDMTILAGRMVCAGDDEPNSCFSIFVLPSIIVRICYKHEVGNQSCSVAIILSILCTFLVDTMFCVQTVEVRAHSHRRWTKQSLQLQVTSVQSTQLHTYRVDIAMRVTIPKIETGIIGSAYPAELNIPIHPLEQRWWIKSTKKSKIQYHRKGPLTAWRK